MIFLAEINLLAQAPVFKFYADEDSVIKNQSMLQDNATLADYISIYLLYKDDGAAIRAKEKGGLFTVAFSVIGNQIAAIHFSTNTDRQLQHVLKAAIFSTAKYWNCSDEKEYVFVLPIVFGNRSASFVRSDDFTISDFLTFDSGFSLLHKPVFILEPYISEMICNDDDELYKN